MRETVSAYERASHSALWASVSHALSVAQAAHVDMPHTIAGRAAVPVATYRKLRNERGAHAYETAGPDTIARLADALTINTIALLCGEVAKPDAASRRLSRIMRHKPRCEIARLLAIPILREAARLQLSRPALAEAAGLTWHATTNALYVRTLALHRSSMLAEAVNRDFAWLLTQATRVK